MKLSEKLGAALNMIAIECGLSHNVKWIDAKKEVIDEFNALEEKFQALESRLTQSIPHFETPAKRKYTKR